MERILAEAGVTKGALYHHFRGKRALGYAVMDEILPGWVTDRWLKPVESSPDVLSALVELARWGERSVSAEGLSLGCPLHSLTQELGGCDEGFRLRLLAIYDDWMEGLAELLVKAQKRGVVRADVDVRGAATFIVAAWEGSIGLAKCSRAVGTLRSCRQGLEGYLESLRPTSAR